MNYTLKHENTTRYYELKTGAKWMPGGEQGDDASARLAADLAAKYIGHATYIKQIKRTNNYNGLSVENITYIARDARVIPALIINHNYNGLYPTDETYTAARIVATIAKKAGYTAEIRGYYTATLIY